jgi:hypothetical protein
VRDPLNPLASNWALGSASPLLGGLVNQFPTRAYDHTVLVRFCGVAVTFGVDQKLGSSCWNRLSWLWWRLEPEKRKLLSPWLVAHFDPLFSIYVLPWSNFSVLILPSGILLLLFITLGDDQPPEM